MVMVLAFSQFPPSESAGYPDLVSYLVSDSKQTRKEKVPPDPIPYATSDIAIKLSPQVVKITPPVDFYHTGVRAARPPLLFSLEDSRHPTHCEGG